MAIEFNTEFYVQSKFNQLEATGQLSEFGLTDVASLAQFFEDNGVDAREHYLAVGMSEGIDPSAEFDTSAYLEAKLAQLQGEEFGGEYADFTVQDVIEAFQANGLTALEHFNQIGEAEGLVATPVANESSGLTEALEGLLTAQANKASFLEGTLDIKAVADEVEATAADAENPTLEEIETAIGEVLSDAITAVNAESDDVADISAARSDAYNNALIEEQQQINAKRVSDAENDVAGVTGLAKAVGALTSAQTNYTTAVEAQEDTAADAAGAEAKFSTISRDTAITADYTAPAADDVSSNIVVDTNNASAAIISIDADGKLVVADAYADAEGIDALLAAVQADFNAIKGVANAEETLRSSIADVLVLENDEAVLDNSTTFTVYDAAADSTDATLDSFYTDADGNLYVSADSPLSDAVGSESELFLVTDISVTDADGSTATVTIADAASADAVIGTDGGVADFDALSANNVIEFSASDVDVTKYINTADADNGYLTAAFGDDAPLSQELNAAQNEQTAFDKAVNDYLAAKATSEDLEGYNDAIETAVSAIEDLDYVVDDNNAGSANNDVFVFAGEDATISGFGAQGDDVLYIGGGYTKVDLESSVNIATSSQGSSSTLEVFFQQQGNDAVIYLESEAFQGNAKTAFEGNTITLTGVDADSLQYENGTVSIVEVA